MKFVVYESFFPPHEAERAVVWLWCARVVWALLPITAGDALADALGDWSRGPARVAAALLWTAWAAGLVALLAPRPWGVTVLRIAAPGAVAVAVAASVSSGAASAAVAIGSAVVAAVLALSSLVTDAAGNALAYGDESRFILRIPTPLLFGPVPLAVVIVAGTLVGPVLIADGSYIAGAVVLALGLPLAFVLVRSLHALSKRWVVLVPAGLVVVDPLTLVDPIMVRREHIQSLGTRAPDVDAVDLRLGTRAGSIALTAREPMTLVRRAGRNAATNVTARVVLVAPVRAAPLLAAARDRRIPVP